MNAKFMQFAPHIAIGAIFSKAGYDILTTSSSMKSLTHQTSGEDTKLDGKTSTLVAKAMEKLSLDESTRSRYFFFVTSEIDPVTKGNSHWRTGAVIGLPFSFRFNSPADAENSPLVVKGQQVRCDWDSEDGKLLAKALVLSDEAKSFVIARDVNMLRMFMSHTEVFLQAAFVVFGYTTLTSFDKYMMSVRKLPNWTRYTALSLVAGAVLMAYMGVADMYRCSKDIRSDRKTAELSQEFAKGGVEYYEKVIERNRLIRALMGEQASSIYTAEGDEVRGLRTPHLPFSTRLTYLKNYLANYEQKDQAK